MVTKRIYLDFEFSDFVHREIISIGVITDDPLIDGVFYMENANESKKFTSEWVKLNVYPLLDNISQCNINQLSARLWGWLEDLPCDQIQVVVDYKGDYDLLIELLDDKHPKLNENPIFIFDSITASAIAYSIGRSCSAKDLLSDAKNYYFGEFDGWFVDNQLPQHNAINDACAIKDTFEKTIAEFAFLEILRNV